MANKVTVEYYEAVQGNRQFAAIRLDSEFPGFKRGLEWEAYFVCDPHDDGTATVRRIPLTILWHSEAGPIKKSRAKKQLVQRVEQLVKHHEEDIKETHG